jgi:hypothetical protein
VPPEAQGSLADRLFARAVQRIPNPEANEEEAIEADVEQKLQAEKYAAKVGARTAEERNKDPELKQLKAAEAIHNKEAAEDTKALETGVVPEKVAKDKAEQEAMKQQEAEAASAAEQVPPEGNSQGQVAEGKIQDYI